MKWFVDQLSAWFTTHGRDLPWRHDVTPYRVWVSEIMLQQTQVATVMPYFERWMTRFPTLESLAVADENDIFSLWQGLGYYRRARYLHQGAQYLIEHYHGDFPTEIASLQKVPGIGAYTAGAIASMAFGQNVPAIDGNAERVLGRYFAIQGDLKKGASRQTLEQCANAIASQGRAGVINQAIMDLGASLCGKKAQCETCPLATHCQANLRQMTDVLPQKHTPTAKTPRICAALILKDTTGKVLVARQRPDQLLGGLWTFPTIELVNDNVSKNHKELLLRSPRIALWHAWLKTHGLTAPLASCTPSYVWIRHIFTHIDMLMTWDIAHYNAPISLDALKPDATLDQFDLVMQKSSTLDMQDHPSSTLMKKILAQL